MYRAIFRKNPLPMWLYDKETLRFIDVNNAAIEQYGYSLKEFLNMSITDIRSESEVKRLLSYIKTTGSSPSDTHKQAGAWKHLKKDGTSIEVDIVRTTVNIGGRIAHLALIKDVTEQRRAERDLIRSEKQFRTLVESMIEGILQVNNDDSIEYANNQFCEMTGYSREELIGRKAPELLLSNQEQRRKMSKISDDRKQGKSYHYEIEVRKKSGEMVYHLISGTPLYGENGEITGSMGIHSDITERKQLEQEQLRVRVAEAINKELQKEIAARKEIESKLRDTQNFTGSIIASSLDMIIACDKKSAIYLFNKAAENAFGYSFEEIKGKHVDVLYSNRSQHNYVREQLEQTGVFSGEINNVRKNGEIFISYLSASMIRNEDGEVFGFMGVSRDVTETKLAEEKLINSVKEKEVLLREVHHRVKNNLQVISSILNLQSSGVRKNKKMVELINNSQNRIKTMSYIHECLYKSADLSQIKFSDYVTNLSNNLMQTYHRKNCVIKLNVKVNKEVELPLDRAISCGLIINELLTNSLKYAFTDRLTGRINVIISEKEGIIKMNLSDDGVGFKNEFDLASTNTLGLQLVTTLVEQLRGKITVKEKRGIKYFIVFNA